ncbi:hypothetical protein ACGC1H_003742 [Rhizoctonia solani]
MPVNEVAENILATIGTVLWTAQLVPQVVKSYREKSTEGLSPWLMFIWALSAWFLGVYAIVQNISIPIILQPQLFGALAALSWIQCLYYGSKKSRLFCASLYMAFLVAMAGFEVGLSLVIRSGGRVAYPRHGDYECSPNFSRIVTSVLGDMEAKRGCWNLDAFHVGRHARRCL